MTLWHGVLSLQQEVGTGDVSNLDPLTEDALICNLQQRYMRDQIYTYIGTMVIALNPYKSLSLYTPEMIVAYQHHRIYELPPHIYAIAEYVFQSMKDRNVDQCIIATGESGSGKTESCKIALEYLMLASSPFNQLGNVKDKLLNISTVLEAFGNAKTRHNDNASRFGKFLDIEFDFRGDPMGGSITNYLLEKSRVTKQSPEERNFHIFYQILNGSDVHLLKCLKLQRNPANYNILNDRQSFDIDDRINFVTTKRCMEIMDFTQNEMSYAFQIVAAVLKLGNLQFLPRANIDGTEGCSLLNQYEIYDVCELLQTDIDLLENAFIQRTVEVRHEVLVTNLSASEAICSRDALCKALYSRLFTWIVNRINESIRAKQISKRKSIGILDIYGFEVLETNRFEQFLINYCNEKLQQIFINFNLKHEQEEYIKEGIQWKRIDFFNNSVICDLIERNNHGILALLDEECLRPNPITDEMFLRYLTNAIRDNPYFESHGCKSFVVPHLKLSCEYDNPGSSTPSLPQQWFRLRHFTGTVTYSVNGFIDKNNDLLLRNLSFVMYQSDHSLLKLLFPEGNPKRTLTKRPVSTAMQFKISIASLMKNIQCKELNFIKCIKPNVLKEPSVFETNLVQHQLRYSLLLETAKIRKSGFFCKYDYENFLNRYKMLSSRTWPQWGGIPNEGVSILLKDISVFPSEYTFGRTKIFIKSLRTILELEEFRCERLHELATLVQKIWRGWINRKYFLRKRMCQKLISSNYKNWKRRRYLLWLSKRLPLSSPLCRDWPPAPRSLQQTSHLLRKIYHKWRCCKYRLRFDQTARNRMREKVTASLIFRDKKASYAKSVSHPFRGDYVRLRQSVRWKNISAETGDQYVVFADIVNKVIRSSGKCIQKLFVVSTCAMIIMDHRTMQIKYRIPVNEIHMISLSPYMDDIAVIHVCCSGSSNRKGAIVFESCHVIEIVTKLFLVIQNILGKPIDVQISNEIEANFGKEMVSIIFRCTGPPEITYGPAKIHRKGNKMEIIL